MNWNPGSGSRREFIRLWSWPISNYMRFPSCWQNQLLISRGGSWACILLSTISCSIWKHSIKKKNLTNLKVYTQSRYHIYPKAFFFMHESYAVPCTAANLYFFNPTLLSPSPPTTLPSGIFKLQSSILSDIQKFIHGFIWGGWEADWTVTATFSSSKIPSTLSLWSSPQQFLFALLPNSPAHLPVS